MARLKVVRDRRQHHLAVYLQLWRCVPKRVILAVSQ